MKLSTRLILTFLVVSLLPLAVMGYVGLQTMNRANTLALDESTETLKRLGEDSIRQKALDVARQIDLYVQAHPEALSLSPEELQADEALVAIAVQAVGDTGYTAVHDNTGVNHFHANPAIVGSDLHDLAATLPDFWGILEADLNGTISDGYYQWKDADGNVRDKYMVCVPVGDTRLRVAATTYIDEFYQPLRNTETRITDITQDARWQLYLALVMVGALALGVAASLARFTIRPLNRIAEGARKFSQGQLDHEIPVNTRDEIGDLATTFNQMARELGSTLSEKDNVTRQLQELNQNLEHKVEERTQQLSSATVKAEEAAKKIQAQNEMLVKSNRDLAVARRQAEEANKLKSQFLATMSHELRTPLNAIIGYADIVLAGMTGELTEEQNDFQQRILANAEHLLGLINDILDLAKIEAGRMEVVQEPFSASNLLDEIVLQTKGLADDKGLRFEANLDQRLPTTLVGDAGRIKQITLNLISNAIKFTDEGQVRVDFRWNARNSWAIVVTDTGTGISPTAQETIFDEFRQIDSSSTRKHGGTGLGLAIVRRFALAMGGNVKVSSKVGEGSTFTVLLPLVEEVESADEYAVVME